VTKIKSTVFIIYNYFLTNRSKVVSFLSFGILLMSLFIGASHRSVSVRDDFEVVNGFEHYVNMASHYWTNPGGYNHNSGIKMKEQPDDYVFTRHPDEGITGSFENEKGWEFILSLIFSEGERGIQKLATTVVRYQMMLDLLVIVLLFYAGRAIAGDLGGSLTAILYALFIPSIMMMSWVSYYYWAIPFSALSLFFWTVIYKPEERVRSLWHSSAQFLLYGMLIGFATSIRLGFLFLPLAMSPIVLFRERFYKRGLVLILAMLIGQGIFLIPQALITYKHYGKLTLSVRGKWHTVISGLGAHPNPFGIEDTRDLTAVNWAISRGGPDLNKAGIQEYDRFMKKESIRLIRERPDIFLRNFIVNFYEGITMAPRCRSSHTKSSLFLGVIGSDYDTVFIRKDNGITYSFYPWIVLISIFMLFFFWPKRFGPLIAVVFQGLYVLGVLCVYLPAIYQHITVYFPVFVLLLAVSVAILVKGAISIPSGLLRCRRNNKEIKHWPAIIKECFREE
jgi:hypothetical protein